MVKGYKQTKNGSSPYINNNYYIQTNKKAVSKYNKCKHVPPVLSSKDRLIKEPNDFSCEEVGLRIFLILLISSNVLFLNGYRKSSIKTVLNLSLIAIQQNKLVERAKVGHGSL